jgi:hypothetical protein
MPMKVVLPLLSVLLAFAALWSTTAASSAMAAAVAAASMGTKPEIVSPLFAALSQIREASAVAALASLILGIISMTSVVEMRLAGGVASIVSMVAVLYSLLSLFG